MSKTVVFVHGSPRRKGNTRVLARAAMERLKELGVTPHEIDAPRLEFRHPGCTACSKCQKSPDYGCHVDDEVARAVNSLPGFDALVLATPVYWFSYPAQLKIFVDRMYGLVKFGENDALLTPLAGKPQGMLITGGGPAEDNLELLARQRAIPVEWSGSPFASCLFPNTTRAPGTIGRDAQAMAKARAFGDTLAGMILKG